MSFKFYTTIQYFTLNDRLEKINSSLSLLDYFQHQFDIKFSFLTEENASALMSKAGFITLSKYFFNYKKKKMKLQMKMFTYREEEKLKRFSMNFMNIIETALQ